MQRLRAPALVAAAVVALVALFLILRPESDGGTAATTTTTSAPAAPVATTRTTTTQRRAAPRIPTLRITVRGGKVVGGIRHGKVKQGVQTAIAVAADVSDEVHLHGYDLSREVSPGKPVRIVFTADIPGRFEIELEERGLAIGELEVQP